VNDGCGKKLAREVAGVSGMVGAATFLTNLSFHCKSSQTVGSGAEVMGFMAAVE
jgi:hypothetical protein